MAQNKRDVLLSTNLPEHLASQTNGRIWHTGAHDSYFGFTLRVAPHIQREEVMSACDSFYTAGGLAQIPLASGERNSMTLRTYRHIAGGQAMLLMTQSDRTYRFSVEDTETPKQKELRALVERGKK